MDAVLSKSQIFQQTYLCNLYYWKQIKQSNVTKECFMFSLGGSIILHVGHESLSF